ncbi:methyltransferase domain-containing protein [Nguyenibacter sp. L1]|uniref:class I SAM-dependent methyltransferase n=1 Tax=Nguyenibacter sp. L1 TaxID=3049350 RepID=UPI002B4726F3|nr:methyltransferase domain-containing protein [Nguyenibacter sp. L1]WRH87777.1 methyltransferase domain-containing protein [Nguyenibacter sp. L1]
MVLPELLRHHPARSVVDVGCGVGSWLRAAMECGATRGLGIDGDYVSREQLLVAQDLFLPADLAAAGLVDTIAARMTPRFDLVTCLEVAEHLPFDRSESLVDDLTRLGDVILFSAAIPYQHGTGHINEQWPEFWALLFRRKGFRCFDILRDRFWSSPDVKWWYAQNMLVFVREDSEAFTRFPADALDRPLARIHPSAWLATILYHWRPYRAAARGLEEDDFLALTTAWATGVNRLPDLKTLTRRSDDQDAEKDAFPFTRLVIADPEARIAAREDALAAERRNAAESAAKARETEDALTAALQRAERDLAEKTLQASHVSAANASLHTQVRRHVEQLAAIPRLQDALARRKREYDTLLAAHARLEHEIATARDETATLRAACARLAQERDDIRRSTSWRITWPIRALKRLFGG